MPRAAHYGGHGEKVYRAMKKTYPDEETAKRVFYATEQKRKNEKKSGKRGSKRG
jgi:hypothetical protein